MKRILLKGISVFLSAAIIASIIPSSMPVYAINSDSDSGSINLVKTATPASGTNNQWDVRLKISGVNKNKPVNIVLLMDMSASMQSDSKLQNIKNAAKTLVNTVLSKDPGNKIALVRYNQDAALIRDFTDYKNINELSQSIDNLKDPIGQTNIQNALRYAANLQTDAGAQKYIVLLSDGVPTYSFKGTKAEACSNWISVPGSVKHDIRITEFDYNNVVGKGLTYVIPSKGYKIGEYSILDNGIETISEAYFIKQRGWTIYTIGCNLSQDAKYVLTNCASDSSTFFNAKSSSLSAEFGKIASETLSPATNGVVTDPIGDEFDLDTATIKASQGTFSYDSVKRTITWNTGTIIEGTDAVLTYRITIKDEAQGGKLYPTNGTTTFTYHDADGNPASENFPVPQVAISKVTVKYVEKNNPSNVLAARILTGHIGTAYAIPAQSFKGYSLADTIDPNSGKFNAESQTVYVNYTKDLYGYTVNYYKDGEKFSSETGIGNLDSQISAYSDKTPVGYKTDKVIGAPLTISSDIPKNVISVYYVKNSFGYTVNYFKDGAKFDSQSGTAEFGSQVTNYPDKKPTGYKLDKAEGAPLTIGADTDKNVINVYYVKNSFGYTVNYFKDGAKFDSQSGTAEFGSQITNYPDKKPTGYKLDKAEGAPLTIGADETQNVINVYYVKDSFGYTVHYYLNGTTKSIAPDKTGTAEFGSQITEAAPDIDGYEVYDTDETTITISTENNVITFYYQVKSNNQNPASSQSSNTNRPGNPDTGGSETPFLFLGLFSVTSAAFVLVMKKVKS